MKSAGNLAWLCLRLKASILADEGLNLEDLVVTLLRPKLSNSCAQASGLLGAEKFVGSIASELESLGILAQKQHEDRQRWIWNTSNPQCRHIFRSRRNSKWERES